MVSKLDILIASQIAVEPIFEKRDNITIIGSRMTHNLPISMYIAYLVKPEP